MLRYTGHALLLVLGAIFVFHSPFTRWWAGLNLPWYSVFVLWLLLIVLVAFDTGKSDTGNSDVAKSSKSNTGSSDEEGTHGD